jgi:hypothetical protein
MQLVYYAEDTRPKALCVLLGGGPKGPPSAPPTIPPIVITPISGQGPSPSIDPRIAPPGPPIAPPGPPDLRC